MAKCFSPDLQLESAKLVLNQNYTPTEAANAMNMGVSTMAPEQIEIRELNKKLQSIEI